ncbi:ABC transporter ATP-binding protein [Zavarzinia sp. CC-PAN008]|uniref:ABC transporter ATP-binding protein n=1 Tax=Zavarzinia sp. CC-PAN008 TaxID=3243332 RepID=UPI003F747706
MSARRLPGHALGLVDLTKRYGRLAAIDGVSLDIAPGEFMTLLGPSGSGKSSILMAIAGFVVPDAGDILLDGRRINELKPEQRSFGVVFQGYALFPHLNVRENVAYPLAVRRIPKAEIAPRLKAALDLVQLSHLADRMPKQLSGGQQQRVALARALVFEPTLLLLDEPLGALDRKLRADLQVELKALHGRLGTTFINVTHDQEEALTMSDRIAILSHGKLAQVGRPEELYNRPRSRFVADFLGKSNFLDGVVESRDGHLLMLRVGQSVLAQHVVDETWRPNDPVTLALRAERIHLGARAEGQPNQLQGVVESAAFLGAWQHCVIRTPAGRLEVQSPVQPGEPSPQARDRILVGWDFEAAVPLSD